MPLMAPIHVARSPRPSARRKVAMLIENGLRARLAIGVTRIAGDDET